MGFAVEAEGKRFVYSGDAGLCSELEAISAQADLLLHWCYRLEDSKASGTMASVTPTPSEIGKMAKRVGAKQLVITHFRKYMDEDARFESAQNHANNAFGAPVTIAEDLMTFDI
jgi:ribonuclease BN (tRNA processing enzyme)